MFPANKLDYYTVKYEIEGHEYKLLSEEYINASNKLKLQCPEGHVYWSTYNNFQLGRRCSECGKVIAGLKRKNSYKNIKEEIEKEGYILLSENYKNNAQKMKMKCPQDHICYISYSHFSNGKRCRKCSYEKRGNLRKLSLKQVQKELEKENYKLLNSEYNNAREPIKMECPHGHIFFMTYNNFKSGKRCLKCSNKSMVSKGEKEVQNFINDFLKDVEFNNRNTVKNPITERFLELDVLIPKLNKAIEFNGEYWHSFEYASKKDKIKKEECRKQGIDLMVINEENWWYNKDEVINEIKSFLYMDE